MPMSMRPQAHDIIRTWAFYTLIKSAMHQNSVPWKEIVISGHVLSEQKDKLSKSQSNSALSPEQLLAQYPADVIRYWTASGSLGQDVAFSDNQLKIGLRLLTKLWNAFLFTKEHIQALEQIQQPKDLGIINEWLLHHASETFVQYKKYLDQHEFGIALDQVEQFFWNMFCDNYLELIKHQLFHPENYTVQEVEATRWTLYHVGLRLLQMFAPYMPHITETIYLALYQEREKVGSIHQMRFEKTQISHSFEISLAHAQKLMELAATVRKLKTEQQLSLKTPLAILEIATLDTALQKTVEAHQNLIAGVTQAAVMVYALADKSTVLENKDDAWHATINI